MGYMKQEIDWDNVLFWAVCTALIILGLHANNVKQQDLKRRFDNIEKKLDERR